MLDVMSVMDRDTRRLRRFALASGLFGLLVLYLALRPPDTAFALDREEFVREWNAAVGDERLRIGEVQWRDREAGVFGFAFSPTLSVLARAEGPFELVAEVAVVGRPALDGEELVLEAMEAVVAVTEPSSGEDDRRRLLEELGLAAGLTPAPPDQTVHYGTTIYRTAADTDRGVVGIGATPAGARGG